MRERGETSATLQDADTRWSYRELELGHEEIDIILDALYEYAARIRSSKPASAKLATDLRHTLLKREVAYAQLTAWSVALPALPSEST